MSITFEHIYFIPSILFLGIAIGFLLGQSRRPASQPSGDRLK